MKVSFDFDSTLSRKQVQRLAKEFINNGFEVHIVTSRFEDTSKYAYLDSSSYNHKDLFRVSDRLGIKRENIHFMNMISKYIYFKNNPGFLFHLDDDPMEILEINIETPEVKGILCSFSANLWVDEIKKFLQTKKGL